MFIKRDATPPNIASVSVDPGVLWPPDRKMRLVAVMVDVSDVFDASPSCKIVSVNSNEPVNEKGGGNKAPDWEITWALTVNLRAEVSGKGDGRVYAITVECSDRSRNMSTSVVEVTVPHDQGNK